MQTARNEPLTAAALAGSVWRDFRRAWGALVVLEAVFKHLEAWQFVPAVAVVLPAVLYQSGHVAVSSRPRRCPSTPRPGPGRSRSAS
jgi:hypothetical protein